MNSDSPYQPPRALPQLELSSRQLARKRISRPGTALIITGSIAASLDVVFLVSAIVAAANSVTGFNDQMQNQILLCGFLAIAHTLISIGGAKMAFLESLRLAKLGAVLACIPLISPFFWIGIPYGLWGLWLLRKPEIAAAFSTPAQPS